MPELSSTACVPGSMRTARSRRNAPSTACRPVPVPRPARGVHDHGLPAGRHLGGVPIQAGYTLILATSSRRGASGEVVLATLDDEPGNDTRSSAGGRSGCSSGRARSLLGAAAPGAGTLRREGAAAVRGRGWRGTRRSLVSRDRRRFPERRGGVRDSDHGRRRRSVLTFDDGPHPYGRRCPHGARPRGRFGGLLRQRRAGRTLPGARARNHRRGPRARPARLPPSDAAPMEPRSARRRHAPRAGRRVLCSRSRAAPLPASARCVQPRRAPADPRARPRTAPVVKVGPRLGARGHSRDGHRPRHRGPFGRRRRAAPRRRSLLRARELADDRRRRRADRRRIAAAGLQTASV